MLKIASLHRLIKPLNMSSSSKIAPVSHVIFDMDGLILDTERLYKYSIDKVVNSFGKEYPTEVRLAVLGTKEQDSSKIIVDQLKLPLKYEDFLTKVKAEQQKIMGHAELMPGAEKLIRHLYENKIPIAVATSSSKENYERKTTKFKQLFSCFNHVVLGSSDPEVVNGKPAPDIFLLAAKRFPDSPQPHNCLAFEDAPNGVRAAKSAGMQVVMVPDDYIPDEKKVEATIVLKSLVDFKPEQFGLPAY